MNGTLFSTFGRLVHWIASHETLITWFGVASVLMFLGTMIAIPLVLVHLPSNFFSDNRRRRENGIPRSHLLWPLFVLFKNLLGAIFFLAGLVMLVLPGQGIITILIGLSLLSIPGKKRIVRRILRRPNIGRTINWLRIKGGKPPLEIPPS